MTDNELAILKSLVLRPSQPASPTAETIIAALHENGYVALGQSGWMATEKGCVTVEQMRTNVLASVTR